MSLDFFVNPSFNSKIVPTHVHGHTHISEETDMLIEILIEFTQKLSFDMIF